MLKRFGVFLGMTIVLLTYASTQSNTPSLDLKFDGTQTIQIGGQEIKIDGSFANAPDGKKGLAIGSTQKTPMIPASSLVGESGTLTFNFMSKTKVKPQTIMSWRNILALRGVDKECSINFYQLFGTETLFFAFKKTSDPQAVGSRQSIEFNRWYQVACTWDGTTVRFFIDGLLQREFPQPYPSKFAKNSRLFFGPFIDGSTNPEPWGEDSCLIRDLKVYQQALSPEEIMAASGIKAVDVSKQFKTFLSVPQVTAPPAIDGKLDDNAWQRAAAFITLIDGQKPGESLSYKDNNPKFCHDGKNLYVGFQAVFPSNYKLVKGEIRGAKEPEAWGTESFEFWLDIAGKLYNFGGNVAGGYCESIHPLAWDGSWQYKTTLATRIDDCQVWQGEICIPFETIGVSSPVGQELKINFCRTWCGLSRIGITSLAGGDNYLKKELFATISLSGGDTAFQEVAVNNPNFGTLEQKVQAFSDKNTDLEYTVKLLSSGGGSPEFPLVNKTIHVKSGSVEHIDCNARIESPSYDRMLFQVKDSKSKLLMQQIVPFKVVENYLEVIPAFSSSKLFLKPNYNLVKSKAGGNPVQVKVIAPSNKILFTTAIASNDEFPVQFLQNNKPGVYHVEIYAVIDGSVKVFSSTAFQYSGIGSWEKPIPEERVLPPFEPLTVNGSKGTFDIGMWGRVYQYKNSLLPMTITALKQPVLTAASLMINGKEVNNPLKVTKSVPYRVELAGSTKSAEYDLEQNTWIEYDGVLWNSIILKAKEDLSGITLKMDIPESMAKFFHATGGGFGLGGRRTEAIDKDVALAFWPFVWIGSQEQGICWFAESNAAWKTSDATPIRIVRNKNQTSLEIKFADKLAKGQDIKLEFGLIATPVKPLPKDYPFTMFGDEWAVHLNPPAPRQPVTAVGLLNCLEEVGLGFYDLPYGSPQPTAKMKQFIENVVSFKKNNSIGIPCHAAIMVPEEYPPVKENLLEWQKCPADHYPYKYSENDPKVYTWCYLCPASMAANYYVYRFKDLVKTAKVKGEYFDFGNAFTCSNRYHGCNGGYPILAKREFYKRIAGVLADANNGEYTIVVHNSEAVQIPVFTFVTHFLNGEGLRQMSSNVFHFGKDLLDTYTLADFASEHSSLPWGITSSIYSPTDPLLPQFGGDKEGGPGPQELYKFRMTKAVMAGALIHNTIPSQSRNHYGWFDKVIRFYDDFKVNQAEFMPYWRNGEYVKVVKGKNIYVSFYRHYDKKELLAVISHVSKEHLAQDVVVEFDPAKLGFKKLTSATELLTGPDPEYKRLYAETNRMRNPVELGDFGVEFKGLNNNQIKLKLKHHSVAIVKIRAE